MINILTELNPDTKHLITRFITTNVNVCFDINDIKVYVSNDMSNDAISLSQDEIERNVLTEQSPQYSRYCGATLFPYKSRKNPVILLDGKVYNGDCAPTKTIIHEYIHSIHYINYIKNNNVDTNLFYLNNPLWNKLIMYTEFFTTYLSIYLELILIKENYEYRQDSDYAKSHYLTCLAGVMAHYSNSTLSSYNCCNYLGGLHAFCKICKTVLPIDSTVVKAYPYAQQLYQILTSLDSLNVTDDHLRSINISIQ